MEDSLSNNSVHGRLQLISEALVMPERLKRLGLRGMCAWGGWSVATLFLSDRGLIGAGTLMFFWLGSLLVGLLSLPMYLVGDIMWDARLVSVFRSFDADEHYRQ